MVVTGHRPGVGLMGARDGPVDLGEDISLLEIIEADESADLRTIAPDEAVVRCHELHIIRMRDLPDAFIPQHPASML